MRYDDASQAGSTVASGPSAHPDIEALAPGSFGPASGNAISGAGTTSGQAGADQVSAAPAAIVEVHGAGGQTVQANGAFQASGQYGLLSMNADGDFSYVRNPGTPDGVQDVFNYTLADASGATSATTLTIDISQVAAAAAGQGVVNLPAGVELSDIHVNGRDLVINMPDGTQMVIPGGAVFVPELAIGDVQVPPTNLAALLVDSEPQPAAGPPQSSGGNFADPVPPLDPGVPLGDLIPPTELFHTPPEFHEVNQFDNTKPTIVIVTPDNPAGAVNAVDSVDESGLPSRTVGGVSEPAGTLAPQDIESTTGTILFTAQDGLDGVTINNVAVASVGQQIAGAHGTLTITSIDLDSGTIGYSYTATDNTTDGVDDFENFTVIVTDSDGDAATGTLHINIEDDEPIALNDTDSTDLVTHVATGNVMTGAGTTSGASGADTVGADNATLTAVSSNNTGASDSSFDGSGNLVVEGEFGSLTIKADGSYVYTAHQNAPGGSSEVFTYTLTDGDGDPAQATLTITNPDHMPTAGANAVVQLDDDALTGGNPGGVGDDVDSAHTTGTLSGSGGDGALSFALTADGAPAGFTYALQSNGNLWVMQGSTHVLTITADSATGAYTVTQVAPIDHPAGDNENNVEFGISYTVTDADGDPATGHLTVNVDDDTPVARNDTDGLDSNGHAAGNVITGAATTSGAAGADGFGADGPGQLTGVSSNGTGQSDTSFDASGNLIVHGSFGTLTIDANGEYTYVRDAGSTAAGSEVFTYTIVDGDGDPTTATLTLAIPNIDHTPTAITPAPVMVDDDDLPGGNHDHVSGDDNPANVTGFLTGSGGDGDLDFYFSATQTSLPTGFTSTLVNAGELDIYQGGIHVLTVTLNNETGAYTVTEVNPVQQLSGESENNVNDINVSFFAQDADGDHSAPAFLSISVDDDIPTAIIPPPPEGGEGPPPPLVSGAVDEDDLPTGNNDVVLGDDLPVDSSPTASGAAGSLGALFNAGADAPLTFGLSTDTSGLPAVTSNGHAVLYAVDGGVLTGVADLDDSGTIDAGETAVFTLTVNTDGSWSFELQGQLDHPDPTFEDNLKLDFSSIVTATDTDGDPATGAPGAFVINVDDDSPTAVIPPVDPEHPNDPPPPLVSGAVDEDDLDGGNNDLALGDDLPLGSSTTASGAAGSLNALFHAGADQPLTFGLSIDTSGLPALTSDGHAVLYAVDGGVLTGVADLDDSGTIDAGEAPVFTLTVNGDGSWSFVLQGQLDHQDPTFEDNLKLDFSSIITAKDADGDPATAAPGAFVIDVDDDSPKAFDGCPQEADGVNAAGTVIEDLSLNLPSVGADKPGTLSFGTIKDGDPVLDNDGHQLSSDGHLLYYSVNPSDPTILEARTDPAPGEGTLVFQIDLDPDAGTYTYHQYEAITAETELNITDLSSVGGGNVDAKAIDVPDSPFDLILSTSTGNTVNTSNDWIGVSGGQSMSAGDVIRVDFVQDAFVTGSGGGAVLNFGEYYAANAFREDVGGLNATQFASFNVRAVAVNEALGSNLADPADGDSVFYGDTNDAGVPATQLNLYDTSGTLVDVAAYNASNPGGDPDIVVTDNGDGSWTVTGLPQGFDFEITSTTAFQAVEVTAVEGSDTFKLGAIDITSVVEGSVDLTVPLTLTDADGDSVSCDIDVNLGPAASGANVLLQVNEAGLDSVGSDPGSTSETQGGDLSGVVSGGTGPYAFVLTGSNSDGNSPYGHLTLDSTGTYSFALTAPVDGATADDGTNVEHGVVTYTYQATDSLGAITTGSITVDVKDDVPTANDDTDVINQGSATESGNVITGDGTTTDPAGSGNDTLGADGATVTAASGFGGAGSADGSGDITVTGEWGSLLIHPNGAYVYTLSPDGTAALNALGGGETLTPETFNYTLTDGDGDQESATLTITPTGADDKPGVNVPDTEGDLKTVYEAGLAVRGSEPAGTAEAADGDGTNNDAPTETVTGTFTFSDGDGASTVTINGTTIDLDGPYPLLPIAGAFGSLTITNVVGHTISYSYTLSDNIDHSDLVANQDDFTIVVDDSDGSSTDAATDTLTIHIADDVPIADNDTDALVEGETSQTGNVITGVGTTSGAAGDDRVGADDATVSGATGFGGAGSVDGDGNVTVTGEWGTVVIQPDGEYTYTLSQAGIDALAAKGAGQTLTAEVVTYTLTDSDGSTDTATLTISLTGADDTPTLTVPDTDGDTKTVDEAGLPTRTGELAGTGEAVDSTPNNDNSEIVSGTFSFTPGDGATVLTIDGAGLGGPLTIPLGGPFPTAAIVGAFGSLVVTGVSGGTVSYTYTLTDNVNHSTQTPTDDFTITVDDSDGSTADKVTDTLTIHITDDAPLNFQPDNAVAENTGTDVVTGSLDDDGTLDNDGGADSIASLVWNTGAAGTILLDTDGHHVTVAGQDVKLYIQLDGSLVATTDISSAAAKVFTATLDEGASSYTIDFDRALDNGSTSASNFEGAKAGNNQWIGIDPDLVGGKTIDIASASDPNPNSTDLLISAFNHTTRAAITVNRDADDIGGGAGQANGPNETLRIDFVQNLTRDAGVDESTAGGYNFGTHIGEKVFSFTMVNPKAHGDTSVLLEAFNVTNETTSKGDVHAAGNNTSVELDPASIVVTLGGSVLTLGTDYNVYDSGNGVYVSGIPEGAVIQVQAIGGATFEAVEITDASGHLVPGSTTLHFTGADFAIGGFSYGENDPGDPVAFNLPVLLTDGDGDTSSGTVPVTVYPVGEAPAPLAALSFQSSSVVSKTLDTSSLLVSNDNTEHQRAAAFGQGSNNAALLGAIAAAGLNSAHQAAAHIASHDGGHEFQGLAKAISGLSSSVHDSGGHAGGGKSVDALVASHSNQHEAIVSKAPDHQHDLQAKLSNEQHEQSAPSELAKGTDAPSQGNGEATSAVVAATVAMPSAEQLAGKGAEAAGNPQHDQVVGKVLAEALQGGGEHNLEALINSLPGHASGHGGLAALASLADAGVSSGHMAGMAAFGTGHNMFSAEAMAMHQDAAPAHS